MKPLISIMRSARALWPYYLAVFACATAVAALALVSPFLVREATDLIIDALRGNGSDHLPAVLWLAVALFAADALRGLLQNVGGYYGDVMVARLRQVLSTRYYAQLLALPQRYFDSQVTGTIIARLDRSIMNISNFLQSLANNFFSMILQIIAVLVITTYYYWPLTVLLVVLFPLYFWLTTATSGRWQAFEKTKNEHIDIANGRFAEVIGQVKVTKSFVAEARELDSFATHYRDVVDVTKPQSRWWHTMDVWRQLAMAAAFFGIHCVIFWRTLEGHFSIGEMVMLMQLVAMAKQPVSMLSWIVDSAQRAIAGSRDYYRVMDQAPEPTANPEVVAATGASDKPALRTDALPALPVPASGPVFAFRDVSFAYEEGESVVEDITFAATEGQTIALVGESGGGKSTLVNLLLGLYRPAAGTLEVLGHDIGKLTAAQVRASVGVVFQEPYLFSGTIAENIAYANPTATRAQIHNVARRAGAHEFICAFPDGYDTIIGERGLRLSGGQKQRVAVARAMLKDAPILVLDEATSALDTKSERVVQAGLEELMKNRTTLIIAHRLSTIASVDTIITLDQGRIAEVGSPAQLATTGGIYSQLLALTQSGTAADRELLKRFGIRGARLGGHD
ncbi:ABC transporter ATP-binding protein [Corynebacterium lizhenjunii]|uniref:ABC transporter ATP-binding protein n=1 Tax=Corynebacterium lizhenjunii TaxID=2709394 RepID=A0A7T0PBE3_9CORY|nr:ABC transporter ATP-binding protein [Corynebacterium lizhenjunii]QPK78627.1 ABC transporter ATP-binding protein [Corynebacterium lizhenjunii]